MRERYLRFLPVSSIAKRVAGDLDLARLKKERERCLNVFDFLKKGPLLFGFCKIMKKEVKGLV